MAETETDDETTLRLQAVRGVKAASLVGVLLLANGNGI